MVEYILLKNPKVIMAEWIPFGENHIAALNQKLGSFKRVKNALFTTKVAKTPEETTTEIKDKMTEIYVIDYDPTDYVVFNSEVHYPEDEGIIQNEVFGVIAESSGRISYSLNIDNSESSIGSHISLDNISYILADISFDSSKMMQTLLTPYQQSLLDLVFFNKPNHRDKFHFIMADDLFIKNNLTDELISIKDSINNNNNDIKEQLKSILMDGEEHESELRQIVDEVQDIITLPDNSFLIQGIHGAIFISDALEYYEKTISFWIFQMVVDIFVKDLFSRLFVINDEVVYIQKLMNRTEKQPSSVEIAQSKLIKASSESSLVEEIENTLGTAVENQKKYLEEYYDKLSNPSNENNGVESQNNLILMRELKSYQIMSSMEFRLQDMHNIIRGTQITLMGLRDNINASNERRTHQVQRELQENTRNLEDITRTNERTGSALQILELILAGALAFEIVGMLVGEWSAASVLESIGFWSTITIPGMMLSIAIIGWLIIALYLVRRVKKSEKEAREFLTTRFTFNKKCNIESLEAFVDDLRDNKRLIDLDGDFLPNSNRIRVSWIDKEIKWRGNIKPTIMEKILKKEKETEITLWYDKKNRYLLNALVEIPSPNKSMNVFGVKRELEKELTTKGICRF